MATKRDLEIYELRRWGGWTYRQLALKFGICRERVYQICAREDRRRKDALSVKIPYVRKPDPLDHMRGPLDARIKTAVINNGFRTIWELAAMDEKELLRTPNFGRKCLKRLRELTSDAAPRQEMQGFRAISEEEFEKMVSGDDPGSIPT